MIGGAHLAALWSLAVLQPLLNLLGSTPEFFVARDNTSAEITAFVLLAALLPPLAATLVEAILARFSQAARWSLHLALVAVLFSALCLVFIKAVVDLPGVLMLVLAIGAGLLLTLAYARTRFLRSLTDILIAAPLVILFTFFVLSDSSRLTLGASEAKAINVRVANPAPVAMVVFDELPVGSLMDTDGQINARRYPNFAALAGTSSWYRNTTTGASYTTIAVPSILTGQAADRDSLPTLRDHPDNLFTLLGHTYDSHAVEPITQLCPDSVCVDSVEDRPGFLDSIGSLAGDLKVVEEYLLLPDSMTGNLPDISQTFSGFASANDDSREASARGKADRWIRNRHANSNRSFDGGREADEMLAGLSPGGEAGGRPTLNFSHIEEPHYPWNDYPDGTGYGQSTEDFRAFIPDQIHWDANRYVTDRATQAHLLEVGYVDHLLGRIIDRMKALGQWDRSLVVVTADHGAALIPGQPRRDADSRNIGEIAAVPLFVKAPGQKRGRLVTRPTCSTRILPLMANALDVKIPWRTATCHPGRVSVDNGSGAPATAPVSKVISQRKKYVRRLTDLFGDGTGWDAVLRLGPDKDLIGDRLTDLARTGFDPSLSAEADQSGAALTGYQPGRRFNLALRQRGTLTGVDAGAPLAISVNGQIAATGESYTEGPTTSYSILLPQWAMRAGRNDISLYEVTGSGSGRRLTRISLS